MHKPRVLLLGSLPSHSETQWKAFQEHFEIISPHDPSVQALEQTIQSRSFEAIMKPTMESGFYIWDESLVSKLPEGVRVFAGAGAGYDGVDIAALRKRGVVYCNSRGSPDTATSDIALYLIIACFRLTSWSEKAARAGSPEDFRRAAVDIGKIAINPASRWLACVGMGAIQREVARKATLALGMRIKYFDITRAPAAVEDSLGLQYCASLQELAESGCDCVSVSLPLNAETHKIISAAFLAKLKDGCRLVNTGRGKLVDEDALVEALKSGKLMSAGLDVHYHEPEVNQELAAMRNVTLLSHIGGVAIDTFQGFERICMTNIENMLLFNKEPFTVRSFANNNCT